ncbi:MAG: cytochrome c-type biogenesis protein CcmH, partial [Dehalococcoidia bacterium]
RYTPLSLSLSKAAGLDTKLLNRTGLRLAAKWLLPLAGAVLLLVLSTGLAQAQTPETAYDEAEAQSIDRMIMCPVCPAESIDQAQVPIAKQMRQLVREKLAQGATRQEILDFFADTYGPDILASPPKTGFNLVAWVLPIAGVLGALAAGVLVIRAMTARRPAEAVTGNAAPSSQLEQDLEPYLAAVDRQLDLSQPSTEPGRPANLEAGHRNVSDEGVNASDAGDRDVESHREGGPGTNG